MEKIKSDTIKEQYKEAIKNYSELAKEVGLWKSEKYVFQKYLNTSDNLLDLGCGAGRTTFPLFKQGYKQIIGVDLTPEMIEEAKKLNQHFSTTIDFRIGDATNLTFENSRFDAVIFSFNGLMSIPNQTNRTAAIQEIHRVLKDKGTLIFTTHDREKDEKYFAFWATEKEKWALGNQNPRLYEFGDLITRSKNDPTEIFIHIPNQAEIAVWLKSNRFEIIETFYRSDKFDETANVKAKSGACRFWVTKKL